MCWTLHAPCLLLTSNAMHAFWTQYSLEHSTQHYSQYRKQQWTLATPRAESVANSHAILARCNICNVANTNSSNCYTHHHFPNRTKQCGAQYRLYISRSTQHCIQHQEQHSLTLDMFVRYCVERQNIRQLILRSKSVLNSKRYLFIYSFIHLHLTRERK